MSKNERTVDKQKWTYPVCKGAWKESRTDWIICIIYTVCVAMKILYLVFIIFGARLFTSKADFINTTV